MQRKSAAPAYYKCIQQQVYAGMCLCDEQKNTEDYIPKSPGNIGYIVSFFIQRNKVPGGNVQPDY